MSSTITFDYIGKGYNIFDGGYADAESIKSSVFTWGNTPLKKTKINGVSYEFPNHSLVQIHDNGQVTSHENRKGETLHSYGTSFKQSLSVGGSYMFFKAEASVAFGKSYEESRSTRFESKDYLMKFATLNMENPKGGDAAWFNSDEAVSIINPKFREDLLNNNMDAKELFRVYGTHWVSKVVYGGRAQLVYSSSIYSTMSKEDLALKASVGIAAFGASVEVGSSTEWSQVTTDKSSKYEFNCRSKGGNSAVIITDPKSWLTSVKEKPAVISFGPSEDDTLIPIWSFLDAEDPRRLELEATYKELLMDYLVPKAIGAVNIYSYPNFSGKSASLFVGAYPDLEDLKEGNWRNEVDSIRVPEGLVVTAWSYPNYSGIKYGPYRGPIDINTVYGSNDWDAMKIEYTERVSPFIEIFAHAGCDYSRKSAALNLGNYPDLTNLNLMNWANDVDSIIIPKGVKVTAWSYPNYKEKKYGPFVGPATINWVEGANDWDSIKVEKA